MKTIALSMIVMALTIGLSAGASAKTTATAPATKTYLTYPQLFRSFAFNVRYQVGNLVPVSKVLLNSGQGC